MNWKQYAFDLFATWPLFKSAATTVSWGVVASTLVIFGGFLPGDAKGDRTSMNVGRVIALGGFAVAISWAGVIAQFLFLGRPGPLW